MMKKHTREELAQLSKESLIDLVLSLEDRFIALLARVEELERKAARTAAPFSKNRRKMDPQSPGRKSGVGDFAYRKSPQESEMTTVTIVEVSEEVCSCGCQLESQGVELVSITDIPAQPAVEIRGYKISIKRCKGCGKQYRGKHSDVGVDQYGATAHRFGVRVLSKAHLLHYEDGIPVRKVPGVVKKMAGIDLSQSVLTQHALKLGNEAGNIGKASGQICQSIQKSDRVNTDDTGWRTGAEGSFLMGFETADAVYYQIRKQHRNEEVREVIPGDYPGVMITDRGKSYDAKEFLGVKQQKCLSHILRNLKEVAEAKTGKTKWFAVELKRLLQQANELWKANRSNQVNLADYLVRGKILQEQITDHLRDRQLKDPDNQRMLNELGTHHDRGNLLRFLEDPEIEPTNNRAERALRGAVIARKVSHCSKNEQGANARTAFMSVIKTLRKRGQDVVEGLQYVMQYGKMPEYSPIGR